MKVLFHTEFLSDQRRFTAEYGKISVSLSACFATEIDAALQAVKFSPSSAGHFVNQESVVVSEFRRRNLESFPFFILYGYTPELIIFGSIVPSRSDPLNWLCRWSD